MRTLALAPAALCLLFGCSQTDVRGAAATLAKARSEIVGGVSEPAHWYVVMVGDLQGGFCSGTLISKRTVLTAGHCAVGISQIYFDSGSPLGQTVVSAVQTVRHPQYDGAQVNDLALVRLGADAPVQPVPLLREAMTNTSDFLGPVFSFVGYGALDSAGSGFGVRRVTAFPIYGVGPITIPQPSGAPAGAATSIDSSEFYYRWPSKNTCLGDSGGPAFVVRQGVERHAGATSYGDESCVYDGVQARTDATTLTWIQLTLDTFEAADTCRADGACQATCVSTSPAPLGTLTDPDCAQSHCAADGVCVLSCSPVDPDCATLNIDNCAENGVCQPTGCTATDKDCLKANGASCAGGADCQSGACVGNVCCSSACNGACEACTVAAGATQNGLCQPRAAGSPCRPANGACDVAEACDGALGICPTDGFLSSAAVCRTAAGPCDAEERCTGAGAACPADAFLLGNAACRSADGLCDAAETCSGTSAQCPPDELAAPTVVCRPATAACDAEERCSGSSNACPADAVQPATTICRAAAGPCDAEERCDGNNAACPVDGFKGVSEVCRLSAGPCDAEERCSGAAIACPADAFLGGDTACRSATFACDAPEVCSGTAASCPSDGAEPDGTSCTGGQCGAGVCKPRGGCAGCGSVGPDAALMALAVALAAALRRRRASRR